MSRGKPPSSTEASGEISRAEQLAIPEHALRALEYQARRHYRRWWLDEAERIARMVIRFDLGRAGPWFVLGDVEMRRMNWNKAFDHFQQAVDCHRADAMAWCRGAEALFRLGELGRAEEWLRSAISIASPGGSPGASRARRFLERHKAAFERARLQAAEAKSSAAPTMKLKAFQPGVEAKKPPKDNPRQRVRSLRSSRQK